MKTWLKISIWIIFVGGIIAALVYIELEEDKLVLNTPKINIDHNGKDPFLNEREVERRLQMEGLIFEGQRSEQLDIYKIEDYLRKVSQVKSVKVYKLIGADWCIDMILRDPIARIFNQAGETFYLDTDGNIMKTNDIHTAHTLVVTGHIKDRINGESVPEIINNDSLISIRKLDDIYRISDYVCKDPLFRSLIGQVYLEKNGDFLLVPLVGDQKIIFGSAYSEEEVSDKFEKLRIFYSEAIPFEGWGKYSEISLKYKDQIVCKTVPEEQ